MISSFEIVGYIRCWVQIIVNGVRAFEVALELHWDATTCSAFNRIQFESMSSFEDRRGPALKPHWNRTETALKPHRLRFEPEIRPIQFEQLEVNHVKEPQRIIDF